MMRDKGRWMTGVSFVLAGILTWQCALPASAAESIAFGQLMSGENARAERLPESEYITISISAEENLAALAQDCRLDAWSRDKYVSLENDIILEEYRNLSIPSFGGIFDGGGHAISGLELEEEGSAMGLFRYVQDGGVVRNLSLSGNAAPGGSKSQIGLLAGVNYGRIENCSVSGSVTGAGDVGGIAGINEATGEIRRCQSAAFVTGDHQAGGICGSNYGTLNNCQNSGSINTHSTEVSFSIEDITMDEIEDINSTEHVAVHTDTGGIAGYSEGKIYYCANSGTVGYQHVGYNTGGIVGRLHQGYVQNCTNTGHILGRKDVGGIAGQLEPFLEIQYLNDKLGELDREIGIFFNLLEATHEEISGYGGEAADLSGSISEHLTNASAAGGSLTGAASELWYIYNQELTGINDDLNRLNGEWKNQAEADREPQEPGESRLNPTSEEHIAGGEEPAESSAAGQTEADGGAERAAEMPGGQQPGETGAGPDAAGEDSGESQTGPDAAGGDSGESQAGPDAAGGDSGESQTGPDAAGGDSGENQAGQDTPEESPGERNPAEGGGTETGPGEAPGEDSGNKDFPWDDTNLPDFDKLSKDVESYLAALRRFGEGVNGHLGNITSATSDRSGGISDNLQILNQELDAAGNDLRRLAEVLRQGGDSTSANVDALLAQAKVLRGCINDLRDDLFRYEGITVEDASDETPGGDAENLGAEQPGEAYYDTSAFQQGKITLCINQGTVEADTNVGGITGVIATEYDFDPEDDIALTGEESFRIEQSVKAVVRESRNLGRITGKKDYVGGVVGKADFGAVISCESYGAVESTGGSCVGGIAGSSDYCIRSCFCMGALSGEAYVGGIAGKGCDIFYSCAYPEVDCAGERAGSVAGWIQEEGILWGNYYVQGNVPGVDSIGYEGGAEPLPYEEFCRMDGVPEAFSEFTVSFYADGKELASLQCPYGGAIDSSLIPEVPEKEGFYGVWPEFDYEFVTGNRILEAQYEKWITSLASEEKDENDRPVVLAQGQFLPESRLVLEEQPDGGTRLSVLMNGEETDSSYEAQLLVRVLSDNPEQAEAEVDSGEGYRPVSGKAVGSYLEFSMEGEGTFRVTAAKKDDGKIRIAVCAAGGAALAAILILLVKKGGRRRKHASEGKKQAERKSEKE